MKKYISFFSPTFLTPRKYILTCMLELSPMHVFFLKGKERKASSTHRKRIEETITVDNNITQLEAVEGLIYKRGIKKKKGKRNQY